MIKILFKKISILFFILIATLLTSFAQNVPFSCNENAYFTHHDSGGDKFYRFTPDFNYTLINALDFSINGIAYNPKDNFIYALNESTKHIVRVDQNGDYIDLGFPPGLVGNGYWAGTFNKDGVMIISGGTEWVVELDITVSPPAIISANKKFYADGSSGNPSFGDLAVDPSSGICYTIDDATRKVAIVNTSTGEVNPIGQPINVNNSNGALYFDGDGVLTAFYLRDIYKINKETGEVAYAGEGLDINNGIDACACLNPIQFLKSAQPPAVCAGDTVTFNFSIINETTNTFSNIDFSDILQTGLELIELPSNNFGGTVSTFPLAGNNTVLNITGMEIPPDTSFFTIKAIALGNPNGIATVTNIARIEGFFPSWESAVDSNDPITAEDGDPTDVVISPSPLLEFEIEVSDATCEGSPLTLFANVPTPGEYVWENPIGGFFYEQDYSQGFPNLYDSGIYNITFTDSFGCIIDTFVNVEIYPSPTVNLGNDSMVCLREPITISAGIQDEYLWQDGSTNAFFIVENYGTYAVEVMNDFGCSHLDSITFTSGCPTELFVPNAFSPNDDSHNDFFRAYGLDVIQFNMKVFDRWGALLFESNDLERGWDGFFKGKRKQEGVYVWTIEATFLQGKTVKLAGDVTLLK